MDSQLLSPDFIFETSWEVCNKVGGIYAVLSTRAKTLQKGHKDRVIFIGPDIWAGKKNPFFKELQTTARSWKKSFFTKEGLKVRIGRWQIPGNPLAILVDFQPLFEQKNEIYRKAWDLFHVDSIYGYGDYDEACMFAYASAKVMESYYHHFLTDCKNVVAHFNEWTTGLGALYIKHRLPQIATLFTTHATSIGRSIAGNGKPLYDYLTAYNGDQMARELNMVAKHSVEKTAASNVDCFTTVSGITAKECKQLLCPVDIVTPNGFEDGFVPPEKTFEKQREEARKIMLDVAEKLTGYTFRPDTVIIATSGRNEYKNKGIDIYLNVLKDLNESQINLQKEILAFVLVPSDVYSARTDLQERLKNKIKTEKTGLYDSFLSHWLNAPKNDNIYNAIYYYNLQNKAEDKVKVVYVPCYLNGNDGIFNKSYYDLLIGMDLTIFPSYYEPWGYTPLESVAFSIPTITTDLSGFGLWATKLHSKLGLIDGVEAVHRTDFNYQNVVADIVSLVLDFMQRSNNDIKLIREAARELADNALWSHFITYYYQAYDIALRKRNKRI